MRKGGTSPCFWLWPCLRRRVGTVRRPNSRVFFLLVLLVLRHFIFHFISARGHVGHMSTRLFSIFTGRLMQLDLIPSHPIPCYSNRLQFYMLIPREEAKRTEDIVPGWLLGGVEVAGRMGVRIELIHLGHRVLSSHPQYQPTKPRPQYPCSTQTQSLEHTSLANT